MEKIKAYTLVSVQFICIILILSSGRIFAHCYLLLPIEIFGIALIIWAVASMGMRNLHATPQVKEEARLVTQGPYRFIRHPMYLALLMVVWPLIIDQFSLLHLAAGLVLTIDLIIKMLYEESLLKKHFAGYEAYMENTSRLIPFIF
jgi:protein-S-isoprenylcysteine O-methyltransferase Ste14